MEEHTFQEDVEEYYRRVIAEVEAEVMAVDSVANSITLHRFVSRSKGIRNGKRRYRKKRKEIHLVKYTQGFRQWHRFPFDVYATEIIGPQADGEKLKEEIIRLWGF